MSESPELNIPAPAMELHPGTSLALEGGFNRLRVCKYGLVLYNVNDHYVGRSFELYGEFSEGEVELFKQVIRPGDAVLDIGANIGAHTLVFARLVGEQGSVWAFEPQRVPFQTLCANMALNNISNARCFNLAVGDEPSAIHVPHIDPRQHGNFGGVGLGKFEHGDLIRVVRLDDLEIPHCRFMKIDVEGMELGVIRGATDLLERLRPAMYVENDRKEHSEELIRYIDSLGYTMYWHRPPLYNRKNVLGNKENVFEGLVSVNMLCLHKDTKQVISGLKQVEVPNGTSSGSEDIPA